MTTITRTAAIGKTYELSTDWTQIFPHSVYLMIGGQRARMIGMYNTRAEAETLFEQVTYKA